MKRTLTAATALVVSSAGAVGFAGTAAAISSPEPSENPAVNGVQDGLEDIARSGLQTVGDVVNSPDQLATAPKAMPPADGADALGSVTKVLDPQGPLLGELEKQLSSPSGGELIRTSGSNVAGVPLDGAVGGQSSAPRSGGGPAPAGLVENVAGPDGPVAGLVDEVQSMNKFDRPTGKSAGSPEAGNESGARDDSGKGSEPAGGGGLNEVVKGVLGPNVDLGTPLG